MKSLQKNNFSRNLILKIMSRNVLLISFLIFLLSCSMFSAEPKDLEEKDGITYLAGTNKSFTGQCLGHYKDGKSSILYNYKNGKKDGESKAWYKNGQLEYEGNYIDGVKERKFTEWFEDGKIGAERNYLNGMEQGDWKICQMEIPC